MAEADHGLAAAEALAQGLAHVARAAYFVEHRLHARADAAVLRAFDRGEAGDDHGVRIGAGRGRKEDTFSGGPPGTPGAPRRAPGGGGGRAPQRLCSVSSMVSSSSED